MTSADQTVYLDSSALVKLVITEPESAGLIKYLRKRPIRVSSALARIEVPRAVRWHGPEALTRARALLSCTNLIRLDDSVLDAAANLDAQVLRSVDAIHLAAAQALGEMLSAVITYDQRMAEAAELLGLTVVAPK